MSISERGDKGDNDKNGQWQGVIIGPILDKAIDLDKYETTIVEWHSNIYSIKSNPKDTYN